MNPSGAGVSQEKVEGVLNYMRDSFTRCEIDHLPKPDQIGDLFRVIREGTVLHQLLVRRPFYDRYDDVSLILKQSRVDDLLAKSDTEIVYLQ